MKFWTFVSDIVGASSRKCPAAGGYERKCQAGDGLPRMQHDSTDCSQTGMENAGAAEELDNAERATRARLKVRVLVRFDSRSEEIRIPIAMRISGDRNMKERDWRGGRLGSGIEDEAMLGRPGGSGTASGCRLPMARSHRIVRVAVAVGTLLLGFECAQAATFRYASTANRIYVENGGSATLTDIKAALPNAPLELADPAHGVWLLKANLFVTDGCSLSLHGNGAGGDVNELRLLSNDNSSATNGIMSVDADWGTLDLNSTRLTSWKPAANGPDTEYQIHGRAFVRARSRIVGSMIRQSTLNVINSDVGYLGFDDPEGYGLTWQVVSSVEGVRVFGRVSGSRIHDCQLGVGAWSMGSVSWNANEISFNALYGLDTSDPGQKAVLGGNNLHDNSYAPAYRWASASGRIYVTGLGDTTLSRIKAALPDAPLQLVNPANKIWYATANLFVEKGARLMLYGPAIGGDVAELRLKSDNNLSSNAIVELRADWGYLDIRNTRITSWDSAANGPDTETDLYRRAFVRARSSLDPDGVTPHESRMDVIDSDIGYLGSHNTEAYGLTWKVVDTTAAYLPSGSTNTLFDVVNVYGDILNSRLHHNYFGMYSYGHRGGHWANNEVDHNLGYGLDPHDDSDYLVIENNNVHDNGWHGIIASKRCDHGIMRNNVSWHNGRDPFGLRGNGLMLHRSCNDWVVEGNQSHENVDSGIALFASSRNLVRDNLCVSNGNAGMRLSVGAADNWIEGNEFRSNARYGFYLYQGNDPSEPDDTDPVTAGRPRANTFVYNHIQHYGPEVIKIDNGDRNEFIQNQISGTNATMRFISATDNAVISNVFPPNVVLKLEGTTTNRTTTVINGAPPVKLQIDAFSAAQFEDDEGFIFDSSLNRLATVVDGNGAFALVTQSALGGAVGTVFERNIRVVPSIGTATIKPQVWSVNRHVKITWTAQVSDGTATVWYSVGGLSPSGLYAVTDGREGGRGGGRGNRVVALGSYTADSHGYLNFSMGRETTANLTYSVIDR